MEANKILSSDLLDLVFEGRNKDYGAYELRRTYNKRIGIALLITAAVAILALVASFVANAMKSKEPEKVALTEVTIQEIKPPEEEKPVEPPPPPPPKAPDPPKIEMKQFTPPVVVKDEEVKEPPPTNEELKTVKIDVINQEGIKDMGIATPVQIDEGKGVIETKKVVEPEIFEKVEVEASYPGGPKAWENFLRRNLDPNVPPDNGAPPGNYTVYIQFVVSVDGTVSDIKPLTSHGYGMEQEAVRVLKKATKWVPAIQNGRSVKAYRKQPITFQVEEQ
jgi:protein TonB